MMYLIIMLLFPASHSALFESLHTLTDQHVHILPKQDVVFEPTNSVNDTCASIVQKCFTKDAVFVLLHPEGPLHPRDSVFSSLIKYQPPKDKMTLQLPVRVDDAFLDQLLLLHNNTQQLRVLLTLLRSVRGKDWLSYLDGYHECDRRRQVIFTCTNDICRHHDLNLLSYVNDPFLEDVLGIEFNPPNQPYVLVALRNKQTFIQKAVRLPTKGLSVLDAVYNLMRSNFERLGLDQNIDATELIRRLAIFRTLVPNPYPAPKDFISRVFPHHKAVY